MSKFKQMIEQEMNYINEIVSPQNPIVGAQTGSPQATTQQPTSKPPVGAAAPAIQTTNPQTEIDNSVIELIKSLGPENLPIFHAAYMKNPDIMKLLKPIAGQPVASQKV